MGDNNRIVLTQAPTEGFRTMTLDAFGTGAEVSLNGGGDGTFSQYQVAGLIRLNR